MSRAVVRTQTPEEREYARYLAEVEVRKRRVAALHAEIAELTQTLGRFTAEYHARVGVLFVKLDRVRLNIDAYEQRIARLQRDPQADPPQVEHEVQEQTARQREHVQAEEAEARRYQQAHDREQAKPLLAAPDHARLNRLYRELCKRYHPDLAKTPEQRVWCEAVMRRINAAYDERNVVQLETIAQEGEAEDPAFEAKSLGDKLIWAIREVTRLDELGRALEAEVAEIKRGDTYQLWQRQDGGERVLERLAEDLRVQLATEQERLAALVTTYRALLDRRRT